MGIFKRKYLDKWEFRDKNKNTAVELCRFNKKNEIQLERKARNKFELTAVSFAAVFAQGYIKFEKGEEHVIEPCEIMERVRELVDGSGLTVPEIARICGEPEQKIRRVLADGKSPKNIGKQEKSRNLNDCGICKIWSG